MACGFFGGTGHDELVVSRGLSRSVKRILY
jgi:hypothetical protein